MGTEARCWLVGAPSPGSAFYPPQGAALSRSAKRPGWRPGRRSVLRVGAGPRRTHGKGWLRGLHFSSAPTLTGPRAGAAQHRMHSSSAPSLAGARAGAAPRDSTENPACWPPTRPGPQPVTATSPLTEGGCDDHSVTYGLFCALSGRHSEEPLSSESGVEGRQEAPTTRCAGRAGQFDGGGRSAGSGAGGVETAPHVLAVCEAGAGPAPRVPQKQRLSGNHTLQAHAPGPQASMWCGGWTSSCGAGGQRLGQRARRPTIVVSAEKCHHGAGSSSAPHQGTH